jgi:hypothetical protein
MSTRKTQPKETQAKAPMMELKDNYPYNHIFTCGGVILHKGERIAVPVGMLDEAKANEFLSVTEVASEEVGEEAAEE